MINNAHDAIISEGVAGIWLKFDEVSHAVEIIIADTGLGISSKKIGQIFDPFFTTKSNGTGLGLAITYRIIQSYDGKISVKNSLNGGAEFTVILNQPG